MPTCQSPSILRHTIYLNQLLKRLALEMGDHSHIKYILETLNLEKNMWV